VAPEVRRSWPRALRFCAVFLLLIAVYAAFFSTPFVERWLHDPLSRLVAVLCVPVLWPFGEVSLSGTTLQFQAFRGSIVDACNGVLPTYIFVAAVIAFPSPWADKLRGILLGVPAIFLVNLARVVSLMFLGAYKPDIVERVHIDVWQTVVVALAMGIWIFWAERIVRPRSAVRR
jgi:exosortase/archaeosortase family protein